MNRRNMVAKPMWLCVELLSGYCHSLVPIYLLQIQMSPEWWVCSSENSISVISLTSGHDSSQKKNLNWWVTAGYLKARYSIDQPFLFSETKVRNFEIADWLFGSWRSMESKTEGPNFLSVRTTALIDYSSQTKAKDKSWSLELIN